MPISVQADYCLQGALSCLHFTTDIFHAVHVGDINVEPFLYLPGAPGDFGRETEQVVLAWWATASQRDRTIAAARGLTTIQWQIEECVQSIINTLVHQYVRDHHAGLPWMTSLPLLSLPANATPGEAIDCVLAANPYIVEWMQKFRDQYQRLKAVLHLPNAERFWRAVDLDYNYYPLTNPSTDSSRAALRKARRVINRGIRAYSQTFGMADIRQFISQRNLLVQGQRYDYAVTNLHNIVKHTMHMTDGAPFALTIRSKTGKSLALACVFIPKTPVLDQLLALALNVRHAESEQEFLHAATLTMVPEADRDDDIKALWAFADKPEHLVGIDDWGNGAPVDSPVAENTHDMWRRTALAEAYRHMRREARDIYEPTVAPLIKRRIADTSGVPIEIVAVMHDVIGASQILMEVALDRLLAA